MTLALTAALLAASFAGCTSSRADLRIQVPPARRVPAPANPDLDAVMERFYQMVEERHWNVAYAMLAPSLRARVSELRLRSRYERYTDAEIHVRQLDTRTVTAQLVAPHGGPVLHERATFVWNGTDWQILRLSP